MSNFKDITATNLNTSASGDNPTVELFPFIAASGVYNLIPSNFRTFTGELGTAVAEDRLFKTSSGTDVFGYGSIQSFRSLNYKTGTGACIRFSARFPSPVALTWTGCGGFSIGDEVSFGYSGTDFGVWHRYGGKPEVQHLQVTTAASGSENATVTIDGTGYTVPLTSGTVQHNAYEIAKYLSDDLVQTAWDVTQCDDIVEVSAKSDGDKTGVFSFSSSTAVAAFSEITTGVTKTSVHVAQSSWNGDAVAGFDPSFGNNYQITFENGYGAVHYWVEDPSTGKYIEVHTIEWGSSNSVPNFGNPSLPLGCYAYSIGSTTSVTVECAHIGGFIQGSTAKTRNSRSVENTKSISTALTNVLTLRNRRNYNGLTNQVEIEPLVITLANDGSKTAIFRILGNATVSKVSGETNFQAVGNNLISELDTEGTTVSGGRPLATFVVAKASSLTIDLTPFRIRVPPTLRLVIAAEMTSGAAADLTASLNYYEDLS